MKRMSARITAAVQRRANVPQSPMEARVADQCGDSKWNGDENDEQSSSGWSKKMKMTLRQRSEVVTE